MRLEGASVNTVNHGEQIADSSEGELLENSNGRVPALQPAHASVRVAMRMLKVYCQLRN